MSHFAVVAPPFFSHFRTFEILAIALIERGHRVTFIHQTDACAWLTEPRIGFHAVGQASHPAGSLQLALRNAASPSGPLALRRVILDLGETTDMLCRELPGVLEALQVDALLCDQMEAAGGLVAEALGLPFVSLACALPVNREAGIPLPVMPFGAGDDPRSLQLCEGSTRVYDWLMKPHRRVILRQARALGLARRDGLHECLSPIAQISQTVPGFEFARRELPACFHQVGPLRAAATAELPLDLPIDPDRPFVFASLGTLQGHRFSLFRRIAQACEHLHVQLLIAHCGGLHADQANELQRHGATWVTDFVPQRAALQRADAVISHGGLNTVMDAIAARTPILTVPIAFDQPGVAARISHAGIGLSASARYASPRALSRRLGRLLVETSFRRAIENLASEVDGAGGTERAADIVESALRDRRPLLAESAA